MSTDSDYTTDTARLRAAADSLAALCAAATSACDDIARARSAETRRDAAYNIAAILWRHPEREAGDGWNVVAKGALALAVAGDDGEAREMLAELPLRASVEALFDGRARELVAIHFAPWIAPA